MGKGGGYLVSSLEQNVLGICNWKDDQVQRTWKCDITEDWKYLLRPGLFFVRILLSHGISKQEACL